MAAGLGVILEAQNGLSKRSQIISKATMTRSSPAIILPGSAVNSSSPQGSTFLDACFHCRKQLSAENDIFMYRGDRAFCSEECRCRHIIMDEECVMRDNCSFVASSSSSSSSSSRRRKGTKSRRAEAGGFAY